MSRGPGAREGRQPTEPEKARKQILHRAPRRDTVLTTSSDRSTESAVSLPASELEDN